MPFKSKNRNIKLVRGQLISPSLLAKLNESQIRPALEEAGEKIIEYTKKTHTYRNRTGRLEASHFYRVVGPNEIASETFYERGGESVEVNLDSEYGWSLYIGARWFYGLILEIWGFLVVSQGLDILPEVVARAIKRHKPSLGAKVSNAVIGFFRNLLRF